MSVAFWLLIFYLLSDGISRTWGNTCTYCLLNRARTSAHFVAVAVCYVLVGIQNQRFWKVLVIIVVTFPVTFFIPVLPVLENGDSLRCVQVGWGHMRSSLFSWVSPSCSLNTIHNPSNKKNSSWWIFPVVHLLFQHWIQRQLLGCFPSLWLSQIVFAWSASMWGRC